MQIEPWGVARIRFRVRDVERGDLDALEWMGAFSRHRGQLDEVWRAQQAGHARILVAEADAFPVGQVWIDLRPELERRGVLWALRVLPGLRSAGIGRVLIAAGERVVAGAGREAARLTVAASNDRAERLYRALGYVDAGEQLVEEERREHDGSIATVVERHRVLEKRLRAAG